MKRAIAIVLALLMLALSACSLPKLPDFGTAEKPTGDTVPEVLPEKPASGMTEQGGGKKPSATEKAEPEEEPETETGPVTMDVLWEALQAVGIPEMTLLDPTAQFELCGVDSENVKESIIAVCTDSGQMDELWLIEAKDAGAAKEILQLAEFRLRRKGEECISSAPEQYEVVQQAYLRREGRYVILLASPLVETLRELSEELLDLPPKT